MKPEVCPFCHRELDPEKVEDKGDYWLVTCEHCHRQVVRRKDGINWNLDGF